MISICIIPNRKIYSVHLRPVLSSYTNWNGSDEIAAESGKTIVVVEVDAENKAVAIGTAIVVSKE